MVEQLPFKQLTEVRFLPGGHEHKRNDACVLEQLTLVIHTSARYLHVHVL